MHLIQIWIFVKAFFLQQVRTPTAWWFTNMLVLVATERQELCGQRQGRKEPTVVWIPSMAAAVRGPMFGFPHIVGLV